MRIAGIVGLIVCLLPAMAMGQRARFPTTEPLPATTLSGAPITPLPNMVPLGRAAQAPPVYPPANLGGANLGAPAVQPYPPPQANLEYLPLVDLILMRQLHPLADRSCLRRTRHPLPYFPIHPFLIVEFSEVE